MKATHKWTRGERGSVLILVLWMLIVLGLMGLAYSSSVRTRIQTTSSAGARTEAYWAARAGIERAKAILIATDLKILTDLDPLFGDEELFFDQPVGEAGFSLIVPKVFTGEDQLFGIVDEAARININSADEAMLYNLPLMTEAMAQSLVDWRDTDLFPLPFGAETDYYETLEDPYLPRDGEFGSVLELARVREWEPIFRGAFPDPYTRLLDEDATPPQTDPEASRELIGALTAWSIDRNLAPDGEPKMNLGQVEADEIRRRVQGVSQTNADSIVEHRESNTYQSAMDLFDVKQVEPEQDAQGRARSSTRRGGRRSRGGDARDGGGRSDRGGRDGGGVSDRRSGRRGGGRNQFGFQRASSPQRLNRTRSATPQSAGANSENAPNAFNYEQAARIIDYFTTEDEGDRAGRININTAPVNILMSVPEMSESAALAIVQERQASGAFTRTGEIRELSQVDQSMFRSIYPYLMTTSNRFGVTSVGRDRTGRARSTIEAVLSVEEQGDIRVVYWREH